MSDEHKKEVFCHYGYMQFLLVFLPVFTFDLSFCFPLYFFLTDTWFQFVLCDLFSFIFINSCSLYVSLFLAPIYVTICIHCKEEVVL